MNRKMLMMAFAACAAALVASAENKKAPSDDLVWRGTEGILFGQGYKQTFVPYGRLDPADTNRLTSGVRWNGLDSSGLCLRFRTDSKRLAVKWRIAKKYLGGNMNMLGHNGVDVYRRLPTGWHYVGSKSGTVEKENWIELGWQAGDEAIVYLPLYNQLRDLQVGLDKGAKLVPYDEGGKKPVVFYGTSITQGGCASRCGMAYTAILQRRLDIPVVNLGFSGSGNMEIEMAEAIAKIDAAVYVIDTMWNIGVWTVRNGGYEKFVRKLRELRPDVPILLMNDYHFAYHGRQTEKGTATRKLFERLRQEPAFAQGFDLVDGSNVYDAEGNGTVDGVHPDTFGMMRLADVMAPQLKKLLK